MSSTLRARVKQGRLVPDEPSSLPEGTEVELILADELDATESARLRGLLADSIRDHIPGTGVPPDEVLARIRAGHRAFGSSLRRMRRHKPCLLPSGGERTVRRLSVQRKPASAPTKECVRASFEKQELMRLLGAELGDIAQG